MVSLVTDENMPIPPEGMRNHKDSYAYIKSGEHVLNQINKYVPLRPDFRVLDVGCAAGRLSLPLLSILDSKNGVYEGIDIRKDRIQWAQENISSRYENVHFTFFDIKNKFMNPEGKIEGDSFTFPYPDDEFDLIIYHSVFTHLDDRVARRYLRESARVLKPGGCIYATFYIWDEETASCLQHNQTAWRFNHDFGTFRVEDEQKLEKAVAFKHRWLLESLEDSGLSIRNVMRGDWRNGNNQGQDVYYFTKQVHPTDD